MVRVLLWLAVVPIVAGLVYSAVCIVVAMRLTQPHRQAQVTTPAAYGAPFEEAVVASRDGLKLAAWFLPVAGSDRAVLMIHGKDSCRSCEFQGHFVELATHLQRQGFNVLLIDLRGHGQSEGERFTGDREKWDVLGGVDWLRSRGIAKIGVLGVSFGGASAVEAAAEPDGQATIQALVMDSVFGDVRQALNKKFPEDSGLPLAFLPGGLLVARAAYHANYDALQPSANLSHVKAAVMIIYGAQDDLVPMEQYTAMLAVRPEATTWLVPDAGHSRSYVAHPDEYSQRVSDFFAQALR